MKYIYHHLGLGDHIICNGLVRCLINPQEEYTLFVKPHNITSVAFMYRDLPNISLHDADDSDVTKFFDENIIHESDKIIAGFYKHPESKEFDDSFYLQHNLPFSYRWDKFHAIRDLDSEIEFFNKFNIKENEYVFIHDDYSRGFKINEELIEHKNLPIIRPVLGLTNNIFDYCYLMQNSIESHFIDSSFRLLFDSFQLRNDNIFYHQKYDSVNRGGAKSNSILKFKIF